MLVAAGVALLAPAAAAADVTSAAASAAKSAPKIASAASTCRGAKGAKSKKARRRAIACLVNHVRHRSGLRGFRGSRSLAVAAGRHARDMVRARYFAHQRAGGPSLSSRARSAGWRGRAIGEAIAYGCGSMGSPASIVNMWLNSPPHRAILLSRSYRRVGIGVAGRTPVACGGRGGTFVLDAAR